MSTTNFENILIFITNEKRLSLSNNTKITTFILKENIIGMFILMTCKKKNFNTSCIINNRRWTNSVKHLYVFLIKIVLIVAA